MDAKGYKTLAYLSESMTYDFEIKVGNRSFPAVRSVLENKSEYFRALFSSGMKEVEEGVLNMVGVEADGVEQCMSFLHSGQVVLCSENIFETLAAAHLMQLGNVTSTCFQRLHEFLDIDNYIPALHASNLYDNMSAKYHVRALISRNFRHVAKKEAFLSMNKDDLMCCLGLIRREEHTHSTWKIAAKWLRSETTRQSFLREIFQHIQMQHVSEEFFLETILEEPFVKMSPESRNILIEEWFSHPAVRKRVLTKGFYRWRLILQNLCADISNRTWEHMLEFLGENITELSQQDEFISLDECSILSVFQAEKNKFSSERAKWKAAVKWIEGEKNRNEFFPQLLKTMKLECFPPSFMRENIESFPLVNDIAQCLEVVSTFKAQKQQSAVTGLACAYEYGSNIMALKLDTKRWSILAKHESEDAVVGMVNILGDIYVIRLKTLFKLTGNSAWTKLAAPPLGTLSCKVVTFRNRIYLIPECGLRVHVFDPAENTWTVGQDSQRHDGWWVVSCAASSEKFIWLVLNYCQEATKYDPINDSWDDIATPIHSQTFATAAVLHEKLYLVGGQCWSRSAECYDPDSNTWTVISDLFHFRRLPSLCVVNDELYAVGPMPDIPHYSVEVYDAESNVWRFVRNLPFESGDVRCCSITGTFNYD